MLGSMAMERSSIGETALESAVLETVQDDEIVYLVQPADQSASWTMCSPADAECAICTPYSCGAECAICTPYG